MEKNTKASEDATEVQCVLCNHKITKEVFLNGNEWFLGQNAQPIKEGRCCSYCFEEKVVPERVFSFDIGQIKGFSKSATIDEDGNLHFEVIEIPSCKLEMERQCMMSEEMELIDEDDEYAYTQK